MKLLFYPVFAERQSLTDHFFRLHWYFYPFREEISEIVIPCRPGIAPGTTPPAYLDPALTKLLGKLPVSYVEVAEGAHLSGQIGEADVIMRWSVDPEKPTAAAPELAGKTVINVDHRHLRGAGSFYLMFSNQFKEWQAKSLAQSKTVFARIAGRCRSDTGYIFGTGPGLADAADFDFSGGVSIACNSMVRNHALMERLQPPLIVIADPIFHAGPSTYAAAFRKELIDALDRYDADLIVPMRDFHIYQAHLPARFADRIAAVPFQPGDSPNLGLLGDYHVTTTANVLTLFLLPLAATFFKTIRIFGCDGRPLNQNSYFWGHDKASQFNDEMDDIKRAHPGFFDIDYDDYYHTHCETLSAWLDAAEAAGKDISNNTPSHIPALYTRNAPGVREFETAKLEATRTTIVSIDPDGVNDSGHFLKYDARLFEAAAAAGVDYAVIGRTDVEDACIASSMAFCKSFTVNSWELGARSDGLRGPKSETFRQEFETAIANIMRGRTGKVIVYLYCGSFEHALALLPSLDAHENLHANINLFWQSFVDARKVTYANRWRPHIARMAAHPRLTLTAPTEALKREIEAVFGLMLPVAPHPSTTFSDELAEALAEAPTHQAGGTKTVLFPGGLRPEKGFLLTLRAAPMLMGRADLNLIIRANVNNARAELTALLPQLAQSGAQLSDDDLDDDGFRDFLKTGDIIVCPYLNPQFAARTSGLVIDALLLGRPVVAIRDTWLGEFVEAFDIGAVADANAESLVAAIEKVAAQYDHYAKSAAEGRRRYLRDHSWSALTKSVETPDDTLSASPAGADEVGRVSATLKSGVHARRCFIVGDAKAADIACLGGEDVIASNIFYRDLPELNWAPKYYVINDRRIAEEHAAELNMLRGMAKVAPSEFSDLLFNDEDTYFFPRNAPADPSSDDDFVPGSVENSSGGISVQVQLAIWLGYKEIALLGVEGANLDHNAQRELKKLCEDRGVKIFNTGSSGGAGGFVRRDLGDVLDRRPRILLIDHTPIGGGSASGELKAALFADWPRSRLMHLHAGDDDTIVSVLDGSTTRYRADKHVAMFEAARKFSPDIILYRPTPDTNALHAAAKFLIKSLERPYCVWMFDDWPASFMPRDQKSYARLCEELPTLLKGASQRFAISQAMADAYADRYGETFEVFSNGVDKTQWPPVARTASDAPVVVRYAGALAENMTLNTIVLIAKAVEDLASEGVNISFEIKTNELWAPAIRERTKPLKHVSVRTDHLTLKEYHAWLAGADICLIAYNFDAASVEYVRYSIANKMPECMASGAALFAVGPRGVATIALLDRFRCAALVATEDGDAIKSALRELAQSPERRFALASRAQSIAHEYFNIKDIRARFEMKLSSIVADLPAKPREYSRAVHAHVDETRVVAHLLSDRIGRGHTLIDVGAHYGTSSSYFDKLGWTIHCFEPDVDNRAKLQERYAGADNVTIDTRAVSDKPAKGVSFFGSGESTGISGLHAFRDTHEVRDQVDVTTVAEILKEYNVRKIDFLKIDVEGFDFSVLKGVPWDQCAPDVIECEFEDAKTLRLGHTWRDIADYLQAKGYAVYVCEWHPIVRYGVRHDWRRVAPYPGLEIHVNAWGNLLAFRNDPGFDRVNAAFETLIKASSPPALAANTTPSPQSAPRAHAPTTPPAVVIAPKYDAQVKKISPLLFAVLQKGKALLRRLWRRRRWVIPLVLTACIAFALTFIPPLAPYRAMLWMLGAFAATALIVLYLAYWSYRNLRALTVELTRIHIAMSARLEASEKRNAALADKARVSDGRMSVLKAESQLMKDEARELGARIDALDGEARELGAGQADLARMLETSKVALASLTSEMRNERDSSQRKFEVTTSSIEALQADLRNLEATLRRRVAASERQIGNLRYPDAPACVVYFGHHKCGSRFFRNETFEQVAEMTGARMRRYGVKNPPFHYSRMDELDLANIDFEGLGDNGRDVVLFANATERSLATIKRHTEDWKGLRILRDPRQVLISNYFHHKGNHHTEHLGWVWDKLKIDQPILRELPEEEGILYELDNISKEVLEEQVLARFDDERILTIKLEAFAGDPSTGLARIAAFLKTSDIAGLDMKRTSANRESGPWRDHFTPTIRKIFKERYGEALISLGYAEDMDW